MRYEDTHPLWTALRKLETQWRRQGAPITDNLRPGLDVATIDSAFGELGLTPSIEARIWWSWHDGAEGATSGGSTDANVGCGFLALPLERAIAGTRAQRELATRFGEAEVSPEEWWPAERHILLSSSGDQHVALDAPMHGGEFSPVLYWENEAAWEIIAEPPVLPSLTGLVRLWTARLWSGAWRWYDGERRWHRRPPDGLGWELSSLV